MQPFKRTERIADLIHKELATLLRTCSYDPRFVGVTITAVKLSADISHAKIYFSLLEIDKAAETCNALNKAAGFLRHGLAKATKLRITPALTFFYDTEMERRQHLSDLINSLQDEQSTDNDSEA